MTGRTGTSSGAGSRAADRPAGGRAGPRPSPPGGRSKSVRRGSAGPILALIGLLAIGGVAGWLFLRHTVEPAPPPARAAKPQDPARVYAVAEAIDHRQMRPVWTLVNMTGLERICEKARAFTVTRAVDGPAVAPTRFIVYCRDQGFWVVEADPERERWGTLGPLPTREAVEAVIDREGEFLWGSRPPGQRGLVGGLARPG